MKNVKIAKNDNFNIIFRIFNMFRCIMAAKLNKIG